MISRSVTALSGGRFEAHCGGCGLPSNPITSTSAENAWAQFQRLGWTWYVPDFANHAGYALCPKCRESPPNADEAVKRAMKGRKKR